MEQNVLLKVDQFHILFRVRRDEDGAILFPVRGSFELMNGKLAPMTSFEVNESFKRFQSEFHKALDVAVYEGAVV